MKNIRFFLLFFLLLLIASGWLFQIGLTIENSFLTNDFYRNLFKKVDLTPYARAMMHEEIEKSLPLTLPESAMEFVVDNISIVYDRVWLEKELLTIIDDLILYVKGKKAPPPLLLNLSEKNEQIREMIKDNLFDVKRKIPFLSIFDPLLGDQGIKNLTDNIPMPQYFDLNDYFAEKGITDDIIGSVNQFKRFRTFSLYLPPLVFSLCFIVMFFAVGFVKTLKLFAFGFLLSGTSYLLALLFRKPLYLNSLAIGMQADGIFEAPAIIQALNFALSKSLHIPVFVILVGLILFLVALCLVLFVIKSDSKGNQYKIFF